MSSYHMVFADVMRVNVPAATSVVAQPTPAEIQQTVQEAVTAAEAQVEAAVQQAQAAREQALARQDQLRAEQNQSQEGAPAKKFNIRLTESGLVIETTDQNGVMTSQPFDASNLIPPQATDILLIGVLGVIGIILAFPIGRAIARYIDRRGMAPRVPEEVTQRLSSIEQAVDTVAIEMERMSEANRYTTRLLSERIGAPDFAAGAASRAAAPVGRTPDAASR